MLRYHNIIITQHPYSDAFPYFTQTLCMLHMHLVHSPYTDYVTLCVRRPSTYFSSTYAHKHCTCYIPCGYALTKRRRRKLIYSAIIVTTQPRPHWTWDREVTTGRRLAAGRRTNLERTRPARPCSTCCGSACSRAACNSRCDNISAPAHLRQHESSR